MKIVHKQITYVIENVDEIEKIIREQPEEWEAHNRSEVTQNYKGELQVEIYYRLREQFYYVYPHGCLDYSQGCDRCEKQCDRCKDL
tara:strand:+ start:264 stop:521 length:258 start_codon:yes stop_codon:yes gene_type:complete